MEIAVVHLPTSPSVTSSPSTPCLQPILPPNCGPRSNKVTMETRALPQFFVTARGRFTASAGAREAVKKLCRFLQCHFYILLRTWNWGARIIARSRTLFRNTTEHFPEHRWKGASRRCKCGLSPSHRAGFYERSSFTDLSSFIDSCAAISCTNGVAV
jgi:hypothetical protein